MKPFVTLLLVGWGLAVGIHAEAEDEPKAARSVGVESHPTEDGLLGKPGLISRYRHQRDDALPGSVVKILSMQSGRVQECQGARHQWLRLHATKADGQTFSVWLLTRRYPPATLAAASQSTARYILQVGDSQPLEFRDRFTSEPVLPVLGAWPYLFPRPAEGAPQADGLPASVEYLGHRYRLEGSEHSADVAEPPDAKVLRLLPNVLIGVPHNSRQVDETRRYDDSDYELVRLTKEDYAEMIDAGMTCLRVDAEQAKWINRLNVFYWGVGGNDVSYPECLYRSNYLGPSLFLDEPAVCTRDQVIRPRLAKEPAFRKALTPQIVLEEFQAYFHKAKYEESPTRLIGGLAARPDVDVGSMKFLQQNLYSWETMVCSAAYQLTEGEGGPPSFMVFEPPGRVGTMRTLPEINMTYGCQIPVDDPKNLTSIIYGLLRGAARVADAGWGTSIYGQVDRADAFWFLTHAYDLGAKGFFFWDSHRLACVPYSECLALSRNLRAHAEGRPHRDLKRLRDAAEVVVLLPPGYNLGHVHLGKGNLWGVGELNLERRNHAGVKYRVVMHNFFTEIERYLRLGIAFDLLWDLQGLDVSGYREIVRIKEDGRVEVRKNGNLTVSDRPRLPARPGGVAPKLTVELSKSEGEAPLRITARARVVEGSSPVYYTTGADDRGIWRNVKVFWQLYGPQDEDYRILPRERSNLRIREEGPVSIVEMDFRIRRPGDYRLRVATVDMAGRTAVNWQQITVKD